jgi:hypothetical protein
VGHDRRGSYLPAIHFGSVPDSPQEIHGKFWIYVVLVRDNGRFGPKNVENPENQGISPLFLPEFSGLSPKVWGPNPSGIS